MVGGGARVVGTGAATVVGTGAVVGAAVVLTVASVVDGGRSVTEISSAPSPLPVATAYTSSTAMKTTAAAGRALGNRRLDHGVRRGRGGGASVAGYGAVSTSGS